MFRKIIDWLYCKYGSKDVIGMTKKQLEAFNKSVLVDDAKRKKYNVWCRNAIRDELFKEIVGNLVEEVKTSMLLKTSEVNLIYDRFTINGIFLLLERIEGLGSELKEENKDFNPYELA